MSDMMMMGAPGAQAALDPSNAEDQGEEHWLQVAKQALQKAEASDDDHIESEAILKCIAAIQGILSKRQSGAEAALGVTASHKAMQRAGGYGS